MSDSWTAFPYLLNSQLGYVGSPTWEAAADADPTLVTQPVGTGPFKFASYESGENGNLKATRFEDYWRGDGAASLTDEGLPYLDGIEVRFIPSGQARSDGVEGRRHRPDADRERSRDRRPRGRGRASSSDVLDNPFLTETTYLLINQLPEVNGQPNPMADINVRKALAFATDYETLDAMRAADMFPIANGPFPDGHDRLPRGHRVPDLRPRRGQGPRRARTRRTTVPLKIAYKTTTDPANLDTAELLKDMWEEAGIEVTLDQIAQGEFIGQALVGNFQVFGWRNHGGVDPDQQYIWWTSENTAPPLALNFGRITGPGDRRADAHDPHVHRRGRAPGRRPRT